MSKHLKPTTTIAIERLTTGTVIYLPALNWSGMTTPFNGCAEVTGIAFDGYGYALTLDAASDEAHYVDAGETVEFAGVGQPVLRAESDIPQDEFEAKTWALIDKVDRNRGCVSRNVDTHLVKAVADAVGVPALMAAE